MFNNQCDVFYGVAYVFGQVKMVALIRSLPGLAFGPFWSTWRVRHPFHFPSRNFVAMYVVPILYGVIQKSGDILGMQSKKVASYWALPED